MGTNIVIIGSVTSKQYQQYRLWELQQGNRPKIVRINAEQFISSQVLPKLTNPTEHQRDFNATYSPEGYVDFDEDHPDFSWRFSQAYDACVELLRQNSPLGFILMDKENYLRTHCAYVLEVVLEHVLDMHPYDHWLIDV